MNWFYRFIAMLLGRNTAYTPADVIAGQMLESRPLPLGRTDFEGWCGRIISGAAMPVGETDADLFYDSQKFALANMLLHLGPTESHKEDAFFIHSLRKFAVNQVADAVARELRDSAKARLAKDEAGTSPAAPALVQ